MEAQKEDLQHQHWVNGGPAHVRTIRFREPRPKPFEIDPLGHLAQIVIGGHDRRIHASNPHYFPGEA
jgi:hypothetical protein